MTTTSARPRRSRRKSAAWTAAKLLILSSFIALAAAGYVAWKPVANPNVQDCGSPLGFFLKNRGNIVLHPGEPGAPANALVLAEQPNCRDLAGVELQKAAIGLGAFFALGFAGVLLGLIDDRVDYWKAPRFESLLKPMPRDARIRHGLVPKVDVEDLGVDLPVLESPEVWALFLIGLLTFVVLPFAGPLEATRAAFSSSSTGPLVLALVFSALTFVAAALQRRAVYPLVDSWSQVLELVVATSWAGRLRPYVGSFGIDIHHLRRVGLPRDESVLDVHVMQSVSFVFHIVLLALFGFLTWSKPRPTVHFSGGVAFGADQQFRITPQLALLVVLAVVLLSGLQRLVRRVRALPLRPGPKGVLNLRRVAPDPFRVVLLIGGTLAVTGAQVLVLVFSLAVFGVSLSLATVVFVYLATVTVAALATTPQGVGVFEATLALLLMRWGIDPGVAVAVTLVFRTVTFWLPMLPGWRASNSLEASGAL